MKNKFVVVLGLLSVINFISCTKKPNASFVFDKSSYVAGDSVIIKNTSSLSKTYRWTLPYGGVSYSKDLHIKLADLEKDGLLNIKLEAFSKNRKQVDEISQNIPVFSKKARVLFYYKKKYSGSNSNIITVTLNYKSQHILRLYNYNESVVPKIDNNDTINSIYAFFIDVPFGKYTFEASQPPVTGSSQPFIQAVPPNYWNGVIEVNQSEEVFALEPK